MPNVYYMLQVLCNARSITRAPNIFKSAMHAARTMHYYTHNICCMCCGQRFESPLIHAARALCSAVYAMFIL